MLRSVRARVVLDRLARPRVSLRRVLLRFANDAVRAVRRRSDALALSAGERAAREASHACRLTRPFAAVLLRRRETAARSVLGSRGTKGRLNRHSDFYFG